MEGVVARPISPPLTAAKKAAKPAGPADFPQIPF